MDDIEQAEWRAHDSGVSIHAPSVSGIAIFTLPLLGNQNIGQAFS